MNSVSAEGNYIPVAQKNRGWKVTGDFSVHEISPPLKILRFARLKFIAKFRK
jgi:hypothetical protein